MAGLVMASSSDAILGMPRSLVIQGAAAGVALGLAYALSPVTVWFGVALLALVAWAGRGLPESERRWIVSLLMVAIALRILAIALLFVTSEPSQIVSFFWDGDGAALKRRSLWIRDVWLGNPVLPFYFNAAFDRLYGWTTYLHVLAYLQYLLGPAPYALHLMNVSFCMATAVALHKLVRTAYGSEAAMLGFVLLLFLPTPFFWSVSALKESLYVFLAVVALVGAVSILRARSLVARALALAAASGAIAAIGGVRVGGTAITLLGLVAGFTASIVVRRVSWVLVTIAILAFGGARLANHPAVQTRIMSQLNSSAVLHIGHVRTEGHSYKLLDQHFYSEPVTLSMSPGEAARFSVRALVNFVVVPLPWQIRSTAQIIFLIQQVIWYLLVALALVGLVAGLRRDALVTCLLASFAVIGAGVIALNSGNIGTMVRHRDTIVPFVVWLSALGAVTTASGIMSRSAR
jgi:hypothetical protein